MATSGTTSFDLDLLDLIEEAWERATGTEIRTGYQLRTARRSLNLLLIEWQNRGFNLWTLDEEVLPLIAGTNSYTLGATTVDVIDGVIRTGTGTTQQDILCTRVSAAEYMRLSAKNTTGRPLQYYVDRQLVPTITFWPVPDSAQSYSFVYWRMRRVQDAGTNVETQDVPYRFLPALTSGLAWYIVQKQPNIPIDRRAELKQEYENQFMMAEWEDRDRTSMRVVPA